MGMCNLVTLIIHDNYVQFGMAVHFLLTEIVVLQESLQGARTRPFDLGDFDLNAFIAYDTRVHPNNVNEGREALVAREGELLLLTKFAGLRVVGK